MSSRPYCNFCAGLVTRHTIPGFHELPRSSSGRATCPPGGRDGLQNTMVRWRRTASPDRPAGGRTALTGAVLAAALLLLPPAAGADVYLQDGQATAGDLCGAALSELRGQADDPTSSLGVLIGIPYHDQAGLSAGRVAFWAAGRELTLEPDLVIDGPLAEALFGFAVARVGDLDGDGWDDFAVGAPGYNLTGADDGQVRIYRGGPALDGTADWILDGVDTGYQGGRFGFSVSAAGDLDGDGRDDLIVGAPLADSPGTEQGAAFVYLGPPTSGQAPDLTLTGEVGGDRFGWSVTDAGSFLGGTASVCVGAPRFNGVATRAGAAYVYAGGSGVLDDAYDLKLLSGDASRAYGAFGWAVRGVGRWDGDSYDDLVVGAPYTDQVAVSRAGRIDLFLGGPGADDLPDRYVLGELPGDEFGLSLADPGDATGSSLADVLVGAPGRDQPADDAGRAYLYPGGSGSYASAASLVILPAEGPNPGATAFDAYGYAVSAAGDFDGDGEADLLIGAPDGNRRDNVVTGFADLIASSGQVVPALLVGWDCRWRGPGEVEIGFRLSVPAAQVLELELSRRLVVDGRVLPAEVVLSGAPSAALPGLTVEGQSWRLVDRPGSIPDGAEPEYGLRLGLAGGGELRLDRLAGPGPLPRLEGPELQAARPNPFNPRTTIVFRAPAGRETVCRILDLRGWPVATLWWGRASGDWQQATWAGRGDGGRPVPAGVYLVRVESGGRSRTGSVVLAK